MQNNETLRELKNEVEIIGTLKSKELEMRTSKRTGKEFVTGKLVVLVETKGKLHEIPVSIFAMKSSKLFKGIQTVSEEYKSIEDVGKDNATRLKVTGNLTLNEYQNKDGKLIQFNEVQGVFYNRIEDQTIEDKAIADIEVVIDGFEDIMDSDQLPTGTKKVKGFTVGWNNSIIELVKAEIGEELAEPMENLYSPGSTGRLTFQVNNFVEVEQQIVEQPSHGFGSTQTVEQVSKNYTNNIEIIGGDVPFLGTKEYTQEEIEKAKQVRQLKLQELSQPSPSTPPANTGFGQQPQTQQQLQTNEVATSPPTVSNDEMPDF
ncbi:hypothetical protein [Staphylococcus equorum]|uniref:Uncharacterized protein n=1 Tax=Staphylococcus equorum TaxID=246432 RepID=A0A9X4R5G2_9STAP|nr:hypothetical protein [Staphylococcus equorum]MDG0860398.1 hypothetical protein [Staphylococcus equorum]